MIRLQADNFHWITDPPEFDYCIHGSIYLEINGHVFSDGKDHEWTISGTALAFLKSLDQNHEVNENQLIPCCARPMYVSEEEYLLVGCPNGINWSISTNGGTVEHRLNENTSFEVKYDNWKSVVVTFAKQILEFYRSSPEREFSDREYRRAFRLFYKELESLLSKHE